MTDLSRTLADTIMTRFPDPRNIPYKPWCYVHGYVLCGFDKLYELTREQKYFDYVRRYADLQVMPDGKVPAFTGESLDDMMAGTAIVAAWQRTGEVRYREAAERIRRAFDDYPRNSDGGFWHGRSLPHEMWIDGVFMGVMFLTRFGAAIGDRRACFDEAARQIGVAADRLFKPQSGLYYHGYDEARKVAWADRSTGLSSDVWSEGLGWYALVLPETLSLMETADPGRPRVTQILRGLVESLARVQDSSTGLWYQVVDKGDRPGNWHDTSGSAMFVYAIQRAVQLGVVEAARFEPVSRRGYAGLLTKVRTGADGGIDILDACDGLGVQNRYEDYITFPRAVNAKEAVGSMLWAATIMESHSPG